MKRVTIISLVLSVFLISSITSLAQDDTEDYELDPNCLGKDEAFLPFIDDLTVYCDDEFIYIEAESLADHDMMIGITAWNQQVPLPQQFENDNAWRVPLNPEIASETTATTGQGPIAVAINGVMIYNPTQQDGIYDEQRDPYLIGELDTCGGHSGRADDYHYHTAPTCIIDELMEETVSDQPIAYALDGFPIYGYTNADGSTPVLDECGGEFDDNGNYHYHATPDFPYVNACFSGEFDMSLQPATHPIRPAGEPIQVLITDYFEDEDGFINIEYEFEGDFLSIKYQETDDDCYEFQFVNADNTVSTEIYCGTAEQIRDNSDSPPNDDNPPPPTPSN